MENFGLIIEKASNTEISMKCGGRRCIKEAVVEAVLSTCNNLKVEEAFTIPKSLMCIGTARKILQKFIRTKECRVRLLKDTKDIRVIKIK